MKVEMKDSGIEWIGEIPKDWELFKIKNIVSIKNGKEVPKSNEKEQQEENILVYGSGGAFTNTFDILHIGPSVLLGRKGTIDRPQFINENTPFWCVDTAFYTTPKEYQSIKFFYYCMFVLDYKEYIYGTALPSMTQSLLNEIKLPVPPFHTQQQIANFLDDKCADIDQLITLQQQMIDELKAYKQSVITEAVCKGLDKSVPMKDSGIEWIGEVPEGWKRSMIKHLGSARNGLTYNPQDVTENNADLLVLRSSNIKDGAIVLEDNVYVNREVKDELIVKENDILICSRNGSRKLIGKNAIISNSFRATFGAFMMIYRCNINAKYMYYILNSEVFAYYLSTFLTATINQLTISNFNNMEFVITTNPIEQEAIVSYLDQKSSQIDNLISIKQQKINELKEYKKSMIYEYITGKKQVPND